MNKKRKFLPLAIVCIALTSMTSCHRGVGCPNNFSIGDVFDTVIGLAQQIIIHIF